MSIGYRRKRLYRALCRRASGMRLYGRQGETDIFALDWDAYLRNIRPDYLIHLAWVTGEGYQDARKMFCGCRKASSFTARFCAGEAGVPFLSGQSRNTGAATPRLMKTRR